MGEEGEIPVQFNDEPGRAGSGRCGGAVVGKILDDSLLEECCVASFGNLPEGDRGLPWLDWGDCLLPEHEPERLGSHILFEAPGGVAKDIGPVILTHSIGRYWLTYIPQPNDACSVGQDGDLVDFAKFIELHLGNVPRMVL